MNRYPARSALSVLALIACSVLSPFPAVARQAAPEPEGEAAADRRLEARPKPAESPIRVDGRLDEPDWSDAAIATDFRQREPSEGAPATERTEVRVLYDDEWLYIGVRAFDDEPDRIIARQLARDADLGGDRFGPAAGDDALQIVLDTFHDRRNAYYFATNPRGAQVDGLISDEESPDLDWDAVWEVATRITAEGWVAEFAIPFRTLRFPPSAGERAWGFNVQRIIGRKNELSLWAAWSRDNEGLNRISRAGQLVGLAVQAAGVQVAVKPYGLAQAARDDLNQPGRGTRLDGDLGVDAKVGFPSGLVLDLTVNTDFAQVEADDEQIDLTRFNLFFPEKREFFLENAGIFEFGAPQFGGPPALLLFFSRRIGLHADGSGATRTVPILGGARLTGRAGGQTIGLVNVTTAEEDRVRAPTTNFTVARIKRDVGERSYVGGIVTHRLQPGGLRNVAGGADFGLWLTDRLATRGFFARTSQVGAGGEDSAWRVLLDYTSDWWGWFTSYMKVGPNLDPGIGFVLRTDMARANAAMRFTPRPPIPGLRKIDIFNSVEYVESAETGEIRDRRFGTRVSPQLDSGDELEIRLDRRFQRLAAPFELNPGVVVPVGDYEEWAFDATLSTSRNRPLELELEAGAEGFWAGRRWRAGGAVGFTSPHVGVALGYSHNDIDVPAGAFTTDLVSARIDLAASTRLFGNALIQYNGQTGRFSTNVRMNFIHRPGSDLFLVFNDRHDVEDGRWDPVSRGFIVKLTYLYWF